MKPAATYALALALAIAASLCSIHTSFAADITLVWQDPNNLPEHVSGYRIYHWQERWDEPVFADVGKVLRYTVTGLKQNQTYSFAATAIDPQGVESVFSNIVTARAPRENQPPGKGKVISGWWSR